MARIHTDTWLEDAKCYGSEVIPYLNGERFNFAVWVDADAGEIGAFTFDADGKFVLNENGDALDVSVICGKVELVWPDKEPAGG